MEQTQELTLRETTRNWGHFLWQTFARGFVDNYLPWSGHPHDAMVRWAVSALSNLGVQLEVTGVEHVSGERPQIFMSNHQGNFDIFILTAAIPVPFYWVYKHTLDPVPFIGSYLKKRGHISLDRRDREKAMASLSRAGRLIREGKNIAVFPEGTRSNRPTLLPFKKGVFHLAFEAGVEVVPMTLNNSYKLMRPGKFLLQRSPLEVCFHAPISLVGMERERDFECLRTQVREAIMSGLR